MSGCNSLLADRLYLTVMVLQTLKWRQYTQSWTARFSKFFLLCIDDGQFPKQCTLSLQSALFDSSISGQPGLAAAVRAWSVSGAFPELHPPFFGHRKL